MTRSSLPNTVPFSLRPGRNCWRMARAERLAFLIDGASYFKALYDAALNAERSIIILSWDIDTRTQLLPNASIVDGFPTELGAFLQRLLRRKKSLRVHILNWDYSLIYAAERQWFPPNRFGWNAHPRLRFHFNDRHPIGACQHEKLVVIDDTVAFLGGLDLTTQRWDTPQHTDHDPLRVAPDGNRYGPFHDVQAMVAGEVAEALGDLARLRWHRATGQHLEPVRRRPVSEVWPSAVPVDLSACSVAVARTQPSHEDQQEVREIEQLYVDAIAAARNNIFMESQYVTAHRVGDALQARLSDPHAPEAVIVTRMKSAGWLEHRTMDTLRARLIRRLRAAVKPDRFRVYWPTAGWLSADTYIAVHSKLLMVDDSILTIGSANCSNRSMGLDAECNLVIHGTQSESVEAGLRGLRQRLLGEHLGRDAAVVAGAEERTGSMIGMIDELNGGIRRLQEYSCEIDDPSETLLPPATLVDPERPVGSDQLWRMVVRASQQPTVRKYTSLTLPALVLLGGLWMLRRWWRRPRS